MTEIQELDLPAIVERLTQIVDAEGEAVSRMDVTAIRALEEERAELLAAYEATVRTLRASSDAVRALQTAHPDLIEKVAHLQEAARGNQRRLNAARHVVDRVMNAIAQTVRETDAALGLAQRPSPVVINRHF